MNLWEQVLARVETKVGRHSFYTWFKPTTFITENGNSVAVRVPNAHFKDWLTKHYGGVIRDALNEIRKGSIDVQFLSDSNGEAIGDQPVIPLTTEEVAVFNLTPPSALSGPTGLNPRYTFDSFIVGPSNQFAHAACRAVAEAPSRSYNPRSASTCCGTIEI